MQKPTKKDLEEKSVVGVSDLGWEDGGYIREHLQTTANIDGIKQEARQVSNRYVPMRD